MKFLVKVGAMVKLFKAYKDIRKMHLVDPSTAAPFVVEALGTL